MKVKESEYLAAAAQAVEKQAQAGPSLGVPASREAADYMGAGGEGAITMADLDDAADQGEGALWQ